MHTVLTVGVGKKVEHKHMGKKQQARPLVASEIGRNRLQRFLRSRYRRGCPPAGDPSKQNGIAIGTYTVRSEPKHNFCESYQTLTSALMFLQA